MDPNATATALIGARQALADARKNGLPARVVRDIESDVAEFTRALRLWRRKGGFAPRGGWPHGV